MSIRHIVLGGRREFEIADVVEAVRELAKDKDWEFDMADEPPGIGEHYDLLLQDGSILRDVVFSKDGWIWQATQVKFEIQGFRFLKKG